MFLACRTAFAFNIGHFLIILPFHSLLTIFQFFYFFNIWTFLKSLFWIKQIKGSVRVKINEYVHAWSEFLVSLLLIFNFFPHISHFDCFTSLHGLQDVKNHYCAHLRGMEWKSGRKILYLRFPHVLSSIHSSIRNCLNCSHNCDDYSLLDSLYNWNGEHEITKLKKIFASSTEKGHKNKHKRTWMKWNDTKWNLNLNFEFEFDIFSNAHA